MTTTTLLLIAAIVVLGGVLIAVGLAWRRAIQRGPETTIAAAPDPRAEAMDARFAEVLRAHGEVTAHVRGLMQRIDGFDQNINQRMADTADRTGEVLGKLTERIGMIDVAQKNIERLSGETVKLQHILANKQTRGAFGEGRMEAIIRDNLPANAYAFQAALKNGSKPDCTIRMPDGPSLVIDAKFPLEAWTAVRAATSPEAVKAAEMQFRRDVLKHVQDIASKYIVPGETLETAFMFVPSESVFADIYERFDDVIQRAHRVRVVIVSPSLLMLSVQVVMSLLRDQRVREQANVIQAEVVKLLDDVRRLEGRVKNLGTHFEQANEDVRQILISTDKIARSRGKIEAVDFAEQPAPAPAESPAAVDQGDLLALSEMRPKVVARGMPLPARRG